MSDVNNDGKEGDGMRRSALGRKALTVLVSTAMVVSMMPTEALADAVSAGETPTEQSQVKENEPGGGDSENVANQTVAPAAPANGAGSEEAVAQVGDTTFTSLDDAFAALNSSNRTLTLLNDTAWNAATPVYYKAGENCGYAAKLTDALNAAYKANAGDITIVCRPDSDLGTMTHGHVADNITIYGNGAYVSGGECDLEVDTFQYSRETGKQVTNAVTELTGKTITINAYDVDNLGVWGQRNTDATVNVNLTNCDGKATGATNVQRVYISGTSGVNNFTLTDCDFITAATAVYSNADGAVAINNCAFTDSIVPVNFNHKASGAQTVTIANSTFTNCGTTGEWAAFAAPARFVNSGAGTLSATINVCLFDKTLGVNGDILIGDGRTGKESNEVALTVTNTAANVQAQQPGYYGASGTTVVDESRKGEVATTTDKGLDGASINSIVTPAPAAVAEVNGKSYPSLQAAIDAAQDGQTVTLLTDATEDATVAAGKNITLDLGGKTLTNTNANPKQATLTIAQGATATVKNGSVIGGTSYYTIQNNGTATLEDVTATAGNNGSSMIDNHGTLAVASGTYTGGLDTVKNEPQAKLTITGGTFTLTKGNSDGFTGVVFNYGELTISGGEFIQSDKSAPYGRAQVILTDKSGSAAPSTVISGGTFKNLCTRDTAWTVRAKNAAAGSTQVKGGVFNKKPSESYWAKGYVLVKNADGMYVAKEGSYVAQLSSSDKYDSVQAAVDSVKGSGTITLLVDVNEDLVVNKGKKVVLNLNGCTLTNVNDHTIINNGTLTIKDSSAAKTGKVDNLTHGKAAVENNQGATCTISGGAFTRSKEVGSSTVNSGGNSYYNIENFGTMAIGGDVTVSSSGHFSSLVHNGWYDGSKNTARTNAVMTINSGSFAGGINTIKNDDYGEITINGGTFQNATQHPLFNVNIATVNGGSFESTTDSAVYTKAYDDAGDRGTTTIKGGTFKSAADKGDLKVDSSTHLSTVSVSGGSFSCEVPEAYRAEGFSSVKNSDGTYGVAKKGASAESTDGKTSGSVATNNEVMVEQEEQEKFAETAAGAAEAFKNVTVEPGATEAKIGDVTVDTSNNGKAAEVVNVVEEAAKNGASVNVQLVVKANKAVEANEEIVKAAPKAKPIPFELSVDMVTEVKDASGAVTARSTVPVKELASEIAVSITVNPASIKLKNVTVARVHGDAVDIIAPDSVDYDNGIVTFRTSKFSDYAVLANAKYANLSSYKVVNGTRTAPNPADFGVVNPEEYAFAGWYKDAEFTRPYTATAKNGAAYPKFVKISDLISFKGGSLRMDVGAPAELTYLRFGYNLAIPDNASFIENGWYYHRPQDEAGVQKSVVASNNVLNNDGTVTSNIVFSKVAKDRYKLVYQVMAYVKYKTSDGTEVEAKENAYQERSVLDVAQAIQNHQMASATEKAYSQAIINATSE